MGRNPRPCQYRSEVVVSPVGESLLWGRRTSDMFFPEEAKDDQLKVVLVPHASDQGAISTTGPDYSAGRSPRNSPEIDI